MEDRLSALPDELLLQILMLLPLIEVVRTCVLSRRWSRFWTQAPILHVVDHEVDGGGEANRFERVVDSILAVYSSLPSRPRCYFQISIFREDNVDLPHLKSWARRAAELFEGDFLLNVQTMPPSDSWSDDEDESDSEGEDLVEIFELPYFRFAERITVTLRDSFLCLALPTGTGVFASLTSLMLMHLWFADGASAALSEVVSSRCPCLVSLVLIHVHGVTALTLRAASLTNLSMSCVHRLRRLDVVAPKLLAMMLQSCFVEGLGAELLISAPSLLRVEWADCCPERTNVGPIDNLNTLVVREIHPVAWRRLGSIAYSNFNRILSHFRRTQVVELHLPIHPELGGQRNLMERIVLPDQYTDLNLFVEPNNHMFGVSMFLLLKRCIRLRTLHLKLGGRMGDTACLSSCIWDNPPSWRNQAVLCNSLQEIVVSDFHDNSHEVDVLSFILKCAPSLQQIDIELADGVHLSEDTILHFKEYRSVVYYFSKDGEPINISNI